MSGIVGGFGTKSDIIGHDTGWVSLVSGLQQNWVGNGSGYTPYYRKVGNMVYIRGALKDGSQQQMIQLPEQIRPAGPVYFELPDGWLHTHHMFIDDGSPFVGQYLATQNHNGAWQAITCTYIAG